ncbi:MAG: acetolactate decarboxylase [Dehalococcoidia bacterium]|nr:acetolactate decarboxylase [Dehalococcoidia bacterium]
MKKCSFLLVALLTLTAVIAAGCSPDIQTGRDTVYQVSTISALMKGVYDGSTTVGQLRPYGDFGLGTLQALDGEMLELDGKIYQAKLDGTMAVVPDDTLTPFAVVTFFDSDHAVRQSQPMDIKQLQTYIDSQVVSQNLFYAIKIEGKFSYMKTRSVPEQVKPYPELTEAIKNQQVSEFHDVEGTMVGFRCPPYVNGVNVPGYHFHFIDEDRERGGHVLDLQTEDVIITVDSTANFVMVLPGTHSFYDVNLGEGEPEGLKKVEQGQ